MDNSATIGANAYAWALETMCRIHRKPFSVTLALQQAAPPYSIASIQQAAAALGMHCELRAVPAAELQRQSLPCLAIKRKKPDAGHCDIVAVLHGDEASITQLMPGADTPQSVSRGDFSNGYSGSLLMFTPSAGELHGEGAPEAARRFGFRWFVPELLRHKRIWRDVLLASLAIQLMALATPVFTQIIIDKVIVHRTVNTLIVIGIGLVVFMLFGAVMNWARQYLVLHTGNRIDAVLGSRVFEHLFRLPPRYFERRPTGTVVARIHGVETIREFISGAAVTLILDLPFMLVFLAMMFYYSWLLTLIAVAVIALIAVLSVLVTPLLRQRLNRQFLLGARNQAFVTEYVAGMDTVKSLQMEPQLNHRYGSHLAEYLNAVFATRQLSNSYNVAATALEQLLTLGILCTGAWLVMQSGELTVGMLVAFQMFAGKLAQPVLRIVGLWQEFQQADIAVRRLGDLMDAPPEPYTLAPARDMAGRGRIDIRGLGFRYADNLPYLYRDFNLAVPPGQCVSIMGPSGSGKSTLARLLQGFCVPSEGIISIDGHDTRHLAANELRQHFGVVPQDTMLFSGTIHENLALANPHASFDEMVEACRLAEIHDAIELLPQGYQTAIGEHGAGLSGGQKQRIAIARALLKRPRILIFDESTSSLDTETAEQFAATINRFRGRITLIFITHHLPRGLVVDQTVTLGT